MTGINELKKILWRFTLGKNRANIRPTKTKMICSQSWTNLCKICTFVLKEGGKRARTIKKTIQKKYLTNSLARGMWDLSWTKWQDFIKKSPLIGWFGKKKDSVLLPLEGGSTESRMAEKQGFEPWLRFSRTTPLAGEPLRPLGYFSVCRILIAFLMLDYDSTRVGQCQ